MKGKWYGEALGGLLLVLVLPAVPVIWTMVSPKVGIPLVVVSALWIVARVCGGADLWRPAQLAVRWTGVAAVPVFALLGANWYASFVLHGPPDALVGLAVATVIVVGAVLVYFHSFWVTFAGHPKYVPVLAFLIFVLFGLPPLLGYREYDNERHPRVPATTAVSHLDVIVVSRAPITATSHPSELTHGWGIGYYTGQVRGGEVAWSTAPPPPRQADVDRVVLLLPDDRRPRNDTGRWARVGQAAAGDGDAFVVLGVDAPAHFDRWRAAFPAHTVLAPRMVSRTAMIELAERLELRSPSADDDHSLAIRHRPFVLFDDGEPFRRPMNVDQLLDSGLLQLCPSERLFRLPCDGVHSVQDLRNGGSRIAFDSKNVAMLKTDTTIYVNVRHVHPAPGRDVAYLDYWWYLPDNPAKPAHGAMCGAGFVIADKTCFDHQSDWEGVTVVVDANEPDAAPLEVIYAEHDGSTRYPWAVLNKLWQRPATAGAAFRAHAEPALKPLVFVARGTHAAYPTACNQQHCVEELSAFRDNNHDGAAPWELNSDLSCRAVCVSALPTHDKGDRPALWNDYDGRWGTARCDLIFYCSSSNAPKSPGHQTRYERPWCAGYTVPAYGHLSKPDRKCDQHANATNSPDAIRLAAAALNSLRPGRSARIP